jgi:thioester reductase-like protein/aryl carrier-like protein
LQAGGIGTQLLWGIVMGAIIVLPTSGSIPSVGGMVEALKKTTVNIAFIPPSIIADLGQSPELLDFCADRLQSIMYVGGDLPKVLGDRVASRIPIFNQYGATELGMVPLLQADDRDPLDWKYIQFHPGIGPEFRPYRDQEHQLFLVRNEATEPNIPVFSLFSDLTEYSTRDLFVRHPQKKNLWEWSGRADDIIVFLNGEKTNPISMEHHIVSRNAEVTAAIVVGNQRFQASLLLETPAKDGKIQSPSERAALIEKIWPSIEEANQECPAHAKIAKSHILFTNPDKPIVRTGKGTIQRAGSLALYKDELDALYRDADRVTAQLESAVTGPGPVDDVNLISQFITESVQAITKWSALDPTDNLFLRGIDSLQAITLVRWLRQGLQIQKISVPLVYSYPSVEDLAKAIVQLLHNERELEETQKAASRAEARSILSEYQGLIDKSSQHTVILTGSTGVIGSYVLDELLANQSIKHIWCLNRKGKEDSIKRHAELRESRELSPLDLENSRVSFLTVNLAEESFGLAEEVYNHLRKSVTLIIHNAWPVNFNLSLSSFKPQLTGVVNLIDFCSSSILSPHLFFVSSFSSVGSFQNESKVTPEEVITHHEPAINGYVGSKYLAERLLDYAVQKRPGFRASIARVGQVAGAVRNRDLWNKTEWFPSLVISSLCIGALPESLGPELDNIDWVPVDLLAAVLVELALKGGNTSSVQVFHPLNLHPTSWKAIKPTVSDELLKLSGTKLESVPLSEWVNRIRQHMEKIAGSHQALAEGEMETFVEKVPAVKLLDFYQTLLDNSQGSNAEGRNVFSTAKAANASQKLQGVDGVKDEWVRKWTREWISSAKQ